MFTHVDDATLFQQAMAIGRTPEDGQVLVSTCMWILHENTTVITGNSHCSIKESMHMFRQGKHTGSWASRWPMAGLSKNVLTRMNSSEAICDDVQLVRPQMHRKALWFQMLERFLLPCRPSKTNPIAGEQPEQEMLPVVPQSRDAPEDMEVVRRYGMLPHISRGGTSLGDMPACH